MPKIPSKTTGEFGKAVSTILHATNNRKPLWEGPYSEGSNGGITYSLLSRFLCCRHRFWIRVIEGLKPADSFDYRMEYGNAWHICEEMLAAGKPWETPLKEYCMQLSMKYSMQSPDIVRLYECCRRQFPIYVKYWSKHKDVKDRKPLGQEEVFKVKYKLSDGRIVILRGKFDSRDQIKKKQLIQENKSKSDINSEKLQRDLPTDLQSMIYMIAAAQVEPNIPVGGVRYNVVRRPLSGVGKHNIKQRVGLGKNKKGAETPEEFYTRLGKLIEEYSDDFFVRIRMDINDEDVPRFEKMTFQPVLMQLCDWWDSIQGDPFDPWYTRSKFLEEKDLEPIYQNKHHFMFPSGVYNPTLEGRNHAVDDLIATGNERGFVRTPQLFNELETGN